MGPPFRVGGHLLGRNTAMRATTSLYSRGPRSGSGFAVLSPQHLFGPIRPTRRHSTTSSLCDLYVLPSPLRERFGNLRLVPRFRLSILPSMSSSASPGSHPPDLAFLDELSGMMGSRRTTSSLTRFRYQRAVAQRDEVGVIAGEPRDAARTFGQRCLRLRRVPSSPARQAGAGCARRPCARGREP